MSPPGRRSVSGVRQRPSSNPPNRRIRLGNDQRRSQLLTLGRSEFSSRSYDEVSIDDIAGAAGISKGLLYHYFPTKRDLYLAGLKATASELIDHVVSKTAGKSNVLEHAIDAYLEHAEQFKASYVALLSGGIGSDPEVSQVVAETREAFINIMKPEANRITELALHGWMGAIEGSTLAWLRSSSIKRADVRALLLQLYAAALQNCQR
jgi:AcrR family transcriptional regulator